MNFRSLQYLRFSAVLLTMMLMACAANAQTTETGQGCNCKGDQPGAEFKPFGDELSSKSSAGNNKDCNTLSVIADNTKIPADYHARSLTHCITGQSQPVKILKINQRLILRKRMTRLRSISLRESAMSPKLGTNP